MRNGLEEQNKLLTDQVEQQRIILKMNQALIKETQKLDEASKRLDEEKAKVAALTTELEKRREALKAAQSNGASTASPSAAPTPAVAQTTTTAQN